MPYFEPDPGYAGCARPSELPLRLSWLVTAPRDSRKAPRTLPALRYEFPELQLNVCYESPGRAAQKKYLLSLSEDLIAVFSYYLLSQRTFRWTAARQF